VVSAEDEKVFRVFNFVCEKEADGLERLFASVDIVAKEKVVGFRWETAILKETEKVVILAVNVSYWMESMIAIKKGGSAIVNRGRKRNGVG
jgi:hypothetical protein